jgi:hypothetical protein
MKIKMKVQVSGSRNSEAWPAVGQTLDVPDDEGAELCAAGLASPVADKGKTEKAVAEPELETREATDDDEVDALRDEAKAAGVKVDKRWGAERLAEEIAAAKEA